MKKAKRDHPFPSRTPFHLNRFVNQIAEHCIKKNLNLRIKTEPVAVAVETDATVYSICLVSGPDVQYEFLNIKVGFIRAGNSLIRSSLIHSFAHFAQIK